MKLLDFHPARILARCRFPQAETATQIFQPTHGLDDEQIEFFTANGYLVKRSVLDPDLTERAIDLAWSHLPPSFDRHKPETWRGEVKDCLCVREIDGRKGRVKFRERIRRERWLHQMIDANACVRSTVEAMLGATRTPKLPYVRGLYPILPSPLARSKRPRPHTDGHRFLVGTLAYLSDVAPGGGGFHVWPGSHLALRHCFKTAAGPGWTEEYDRELYTYALRNAAVEICAPRGSVIFWHHRLAHAAGINRSQKVRHAVLADYPPSDFESIQDCAVNPLPWQHWAIAP